MVKDLDTERTVLEESLKEEKSKVAMIQRRFDQLASNHEELIIIKDEYKASMHITKNQILSKF